MPGIDLIVATCKEPIDIILDTVKACLDLDYPKDKLRIIVSDDGNDPALKAALAPLGHVFNNLMYFTRTIAPGKHHGYKAGNINAVLNMLESEDLKPNPWVANLDCDMIPDRETLRVLIAPALKDKKVGLVALPQVSLSLRPRVLINADKRRTFTTSLSTTLSMRTLCSNTNVTRWAGTTTMPLGASDQVLCSLEKLGKLLVASLNTPCVTTCGLDGH